MKLSEMLAEWAQENELHEFGDEPCHCDFCQKFIPLAIEQEQEIEKLKNHKDAIMMGVYIV